MRSEYFEMERRGGEKGRQCRSIFISIEDLHHYVDHQGKMSTDNGVEQPTHLKHTKQIPCARDLVISFPSIRINHNHEEAVSANI